MKRFTLNPLTLYLRIITGETTQTDGVSFVLWLVILLVLVVLGFVY